MGYKPRAMSTWLRDSMYSRSRLIRDNLHPLYRRSALDFCSLPIRSVWGERGVNWFKYSITMDHFCIPNAPKQNIMPKTISYIVGGERSKSETCTRGRSSLAMRYFRPRTNNAECRTIPGLARAVRAISVDCTARSAERATSLMRNRSDAWVKRIPCVHMNIDNIIYNIVNIFFSACSKGCSRCLRYDACLECYDDLMLKENGECSCPSNQ